MTLVVNATAKIREKVNYYNKALRFTKHAYKNENDFQNLVLLYSSNTTFDKCLTLSQNETLLNPK